MANKDDYLSQADQMTWGRFLNSDEGKKGLAYLRMAFKRKGEKDDASLMRNCIGFDAHHELIDTILAIPPAPRRKEKQDDDQLE